MSPVITFCMGGESGDCCAASNFFHCGSCERDKLEGHRREIGWRKQMTIQAKKAMALVLWQKPVQVRIGRGPSETINGPNEALTFLLNRWPKERGQMVENAKYACTMAVERHGSSEIARDAFVAAAIDAYILA
jgi:hypothetical protein